MHYNGVKAAKYMKKIGIRRLKYYIGTHAHADHVGGAPAVLAAIPTEKVIVPHSGVSNMIRRKAETSKERAAVKKVRYKVLRNGGSIKLGDARMQCIGPIRVRSYHTGSTDENNNSLILRVTYGGNSLLLTGDATFEELHEVHKKHRKAMRVDVLKNPHHNGDFRGLYKWFRMKYVVVSTSNGSQPSGEMLSRLKKLHAKVYNTSGRRNGHVLMVMDGENIEFHTTK